MYLIIRSEFDSDSNLFIPSEYIVTSKEDVAVASVKEGNEINELNKKKNKELANEMKAFHKKHMPVGGFIPGVANDRTEYNRLYLDFIGNRKFIDEVEWSYQKVEEI